MTKQQKIDDLEAAFIAEEEGFLDLYRHQAQGPTLMDWENFLDHKRLTNIQEWHELDQETEVIATYFIRRFQEQV